MKYFYELQDWLYQTEFYQEVLKELPEPLNNIYFDTIVAVIIAAYLLYRIFNMLHSFFYYRRIRKIQKRERMEKKEQEARMLKREEQVYKKEERLGRFMDFLFMSRMSRVQDEEIYDSTPQPSGDSVKRVNKRSHLLDWRNKSVPLLLGRKEEKVSDYDVVMDAHAYDEMQKQDLQQQRRQSEERMYSQLYSLDESLKVKPVEEIVEVSHSQSEAWLEKQKAKARKKQEKERKREERLRAKRQKKGGGHGK